MRQLNSNGIRMLVVGVVAATVFCGSQLAIADFVICDPRPVDQAINSPGAGEPAGCSFLPDGLKLYFSKQNNSGNPPRDLWVVERQSTDAPWGEAVNLGPNVNSPETRGNPAISPDDLELYFNVWSPGRGNIVMRSARASTDEPWGPAAEFTGLGQAWHLDFAPDGLSVYLDSKRSGGYGSRDIWVSTRATTQDDWGEAVNLGSNVNDSDQQGVPSISNDGLALFFSNHTMDRILMCIRATVNDDWGPAIDLGPAVNGQSSSRPEISPDGSTLYFSSAGLFRQVSIKPVVDFDYDGVVGMNDLLTMIGAWGTDEQLCDIGPMPWGDGVVDEADLEVLMERWGEETPIYTVVDDFESYDNDADAGTTIWNTWIDGYFLWTSGAIVGYTNPPFAETLIVHGGLQAMPLFYDNDGTVLNAIEDIEIAGVPYYSETHRMWPQDWTIGDEVLTLWFYGEPDNSAEPFYVGLEDSVGNRKDIIHPDPAALTVNDWQQWRIPLADFTDVDLTAITIMYIGVGDPASSQPGGSGLVRIDDIELHRSSGQ